MSGMVFHPGHEELHGVTVVVEGASGRAWVGRYHERTERGILMLDVAEHDPGSAAKPRDLWLAGLRKFGVKADAKHLVVPFSEEPVVRRLTDPDPVKEA